MNKLVYFTFLCSFINYTQADCMKKFNLNDKVTNEHQKLLKKSVESLIASNEYIEYHKCVINKKGGFECMENLGEPSFSDSVSLLIASEMMKVKKEMSHFSANEIYCLYGKEIEKN